jgi:hypothetical protein
MMKIALVPHVGVKDTRRGPVEVELDQHQVMLVRDDGSHFRLGYIGKRDGAPLMLIAKLTESEKQHVAAEVARLKGHAHTRTVETPSLVDPPRGDDGDE